MENYVSEIVAGFFALIAGVSGVSGAVLLRAMRRRFVSFLSRSKVPVAILCRAEHLAACEQVRTELAHDAIPLVTLTHSAMGLGAARIVLVWHPDETTVEATLRSVLDIAPSARVLVYYPGQLRLEADTMKRIYLSNSDLRVLGDLQAALVREGARMVTHA